MSLKRLSGLKRDEQTSISVPRLSQTIGTFRTDLRKVYSANFGRHPFELCPPSLSESA